MKDWIKTAFIAIFFLTYDAHAMFYSNSSSESEEDFFDLAYEAVMFSHSLIMNASHFLETSEVKSEAPKDEDYHWVHAKKAELAGSKYRILQWRSPKSTWRPRSSLNKQLSCDGRFFTCQAATKSRSHEESYHKEAAKVACLMPQPHKRVKFDNAYFEPEDIEALLCRAVNHLSETALFEGNLVSDRADLLPHRFHSILKSIAQRGNSIPFLLSFEDDPSRLFPYDHFTIIRSAKPPSAFKEEQLSTMSFYQILLTSTGYPEAYREYHYWITKKDNHLVSEWIEGNGSGAKPDFLVIVRAKGDLVNRRYWTYEKRLGDETQISLSKVYDLYQRSILR